jgi:hypothetical protein
MSQTSTRWATSGTADIGNLGAIEDAMTAREKTARLEGKLATLRSRPGWQWLAG